MIDMRGAEYYDELLDLLHNDTLTLPARYRRARFLFERLARQLTAESRMQFPNFFSRLSFIVRHRLASQPELGRDLNSLRVEINAIVLKGEAVHRERFDYHIGLLARAIEAFLGDAMPDELRLLVARTSRFSAAPPVEEEKPDVRPRVRARFAECAGDVVIAVPEDAADGEPIRVQIRREPDGSQPFALTLEQLHEGAQINLINLRRPNGFSYYVADMLVLEPDFLLDISAVARCFCYYGHHPLNYFMHRLTPDVNTRHILLGNVANRFLDDIINETPERPAQYRDSMKRAFADYALSFVTNQDIDIRNKEGFTFFQEAERQFAHIRQVVEQQFPAAGIDRRRALLEPSFVCETLGIQGRLDLLQDDFTRFVELKAGKADEYKCRGEIYHKEDHYVQMMLYYAVLHFNLGIDPAAIDAFLLYSRYPVLYSMGPYWKLIKEAIDLRNQIVALEYRLQQHNDPVYSRMILAEITPDTLNQNDVSGPLWTNYTRPEIEAFADSLCEVSELESDYYHTLFTFITKEQYTAKAGDTEMEFNKGITSLWNASVEEKEEAGEIIRDMRLAASEIGEGQHLLRFRLAPTDDCAIPNYRVGDAVLLYQRASDADRVTNHQVLKGSVVAISASELVLMLRDVQRNDSVLPADALYAIERDHMDTAFSAMLRGLSSFLSASPERRSLLLGQRKPGRTAKAQHSDSFDNSENSDSSETSDNSERSDSSENSNNSDNSETSDNSEKLSDIERVVRKAVEADDYFLLVGPPGTGKTSCALRRMVETFYADPKKQILLMAYTNKAVDEICQSIESIGGGLSYIRIGQAAACDDRFKPRLLEQVIGDCPNRAAVAKRIGECRVFVGTTTTLSRRQELFRMKQFDVAIIDEATQILEPQLLGLLCASNGYGIDAIRKFILIGDYKQLPAVVVQSDESAEVVLPSLRNIGMRNLKESLFERLYRWERAAGRSYAIDMLSRQGRMHPVISAFPAEHFYHGKLDVVPLPHQQEEWGTTLVDTADFASLVHRSRLAFFPTFERSGLASVKLNVAEAAMVGDILKEWIKGMTASKPGDNCGNGEGPDNGECSESRDDSAGSAESSQSFNPAPYVGIITPYRSQIALIRKELQRRGIPHYDDIVIDTVERFQGGQRDLMIFSCCMNAPYQLSFLSNTIEEDGRLIDRKLNVALTRARKQLFVVGNPDILRRDPIYAALIRHIDEQGGYYKEPTATME